MSRSDRLRRGLSFRVCPAHDFAEASALWAGLNRSLAGNHPLLDPRFVGPLVRHFGSEIRPEHLRLVLAYDGDRPVAGLIFKRVAPTVWRLFCPDQAPLAPAIVDRDWLMQQNPGDPLRGGSQFLSALAARALGRAMVLRLTAQDALVSPWPPLATRPPFELRHQARTVAIDTQTGFDAYWRGRSKRLRQEMRQKLGRLAADGMSPRISVVSAPDCIGAAVDAFALLESAGWKGSAGSALTPGSAQHQFYREVLGNFAVSGASAVYQMHIGEKIVASQMTLLQAGMRVLLKTTFDEQFRGFGVGRVADYLSFQVMFEDAATRSIEFYCNASDMEIRWGTSERTIVNVLWYASSIARGVVRCARAASTWRRTLKTQGSHQ